MDDSIFKKLPDRDVAHFTVYVDGVPVDAEAGETVAGLLLRQDSPVSRTTAVLENARAPYCMMGVCFDCLAIVDGVPSTQSCLVAVRDGMRIERQHGRRELTA